MSDLISRQAAIDICNTAIDLWHGQLGEGIVIAVKKKIEELPTAQPEHNVHDFPKDADCISRKAAIDSICRTVCDNPEICESPCDEIKVLEIMPSAQPCTDQWCLDCKEYDKENDCCPRYNRVIRKTLDEAYALGETEAEARFHAEIVRCKECTFYRSDGCFFSTAEVGEDGFCSWAKRRTDE